MATKTAFRTLAMVGERVAAEWERERALREAFVQQFRDQGLEPPRIIHQFGVWAVTDRGIDCLEQTYFIDRHRLHHQGWPLHLAEKSWVVMADFLRVWHEARHHHFPDQYPPLEAIAGDMP